MAEADAVVVEKEWAEVEAKVEAEVVAEKRAVTVRIDNKTSEKIIRTIIKD